MPAGAKRFPVEVDENCVLHITQAALAPGAKKGSRASVSVTVDGEPPVVLGTLTGGSCDQMMMDLLFHADFHVDVTNGPVYLSGYMTLVGDGLDDMALDEAEGDDYDDSDSDSDDDDYDAEAGSDDYDSDLDDYADYDSEGDDDGEELDIEDLPPKLQLKLLKHTKALEKARGEADDSDLNHCTRSGRRTRKRLWELPMLRPTGRFSRYPFISTSCDDRRARAATIELPAPP